MPVWARRDDSADIGGSLTLAGTFDRHETIGDDLEVIPTPGVTEDDQPISVVRDVDERRARVQAVIDRVAAGGSR